MLGYHVQFLRRHTVTVRQNVQQFINCCANYEFTKGAAQFINCTNSQIVPNRKIMS